ncbi:hypothetical protein U6B65_05910 [Oscillospiraceae bacterium MB08-C2-2]|nr:hypothetical protein U6B65_05910 [Oscillospiraceae bacterium MB08-C2-2]
MTVIIKNSFSEKLFMVETGKLLAILKNAKVFGSEKAVMSPDKTVQYQTNIANMPDKPAGKNRQYTLKQGSQTVATARPVYAADADYFSISKPPHPVGMSIQVHSGTEWQVVRSEKNHLEIHTQDGFATLTDFFSIGPQVMEVPDGSDILLWAGVYALIEYMMHEDEVSPV